MYSLTVKFPLIYRDISEFLDLAGNFPSIFQCN